MCWCTELGVDTPSRYLAKTATIPCIHRSSPQAALVMCSGEPSTSRAIHTLTDGQTDKWTYTQTDIQTENRQTHRQTGG